MIKSIRTIMKQDKERYKVPRKVQAVIPIRRIWPDGIFQVGSKFTKMYRFTDINYLVASREDKESMFLTYSELLNSLDSGATTSRRWMRASCQSVPTMAMVVSVFPVPISMSSAAPPPDSRRSSAKAAALRWC